VSNTRRLERREVKNRLWPPGHWLPPVLEVAYLICNEGHAATAGEDWMRPGLCEEALRLG
jgi:predicted RNA polymerase sigma factor